MPVLSGDIPLSAKREVSKAVARAERSAAKAIAKARIDAESMLAAAKAKAMKDIADARSKAESLVCLSKSNVVVGKHVDSALAIDIVHDKKTTTPRGVLDRTGAYGNKEKSKKKVDLKEELVKMDNLPDAIPADSPSKAEKTPFNKQSSPKSSSSPSAKKQTQANPIILKQGDKIEVFLESSHKWSSGRIVSSREDGTFDITFDNGTKAGLVCKDNIRHPIHVLRIGDNVVARYMGGTRWYPGKVIALNEGGTVNIKYTEGFEEYCVSVDRVRATGDSLRASDFETKFQYFRQQFVDICIFSGVVLPIHMTDENSGRFFKFIENKTPYLLYDFIVSHSDNVDIVKCAASLLIVTMSILHDKREKFRQTTNKEHINAQEVHFYSWITSSLETLSDHNCVQTIIRVITLTSKLPIYELLLNLLAKMIFISSAAAEQMLLPLVRTETERKKTSVSVEDAPDVTCISYVFSVGALNKSRDVIVAAVADIVIGIIRAHQASPNLQDVCEIIAKTLVVPLPVKKNEHISHNLGLTLGSSADEDYAALRILLTFLKRFQTCVGSTDVCDPMLANHPLSQNETLFYAHKKVVSATALIIANSHEVALYAISIGAGGILKNSQRTALPNGSEHALINDCLLHMKYTKTVANDEEIKGILNVELVSCSDLYSDPYSDG